MREYILTNYLCYSSCFDVGSSRFDWSLWSGAFLHSMSKCPQGRKVPQIPAMPATPLRPCKIYAKYMMSDLIIFSLLEASFYQSMHEDHSRQHVAQLCSYLCESLYMHIYRILPANSWCSPSVLVLTLAAFAH
jgi:hypothetical protein